MDSATPRIEFAIQEVEGKLADVRRQLDGNRELLAAVKRSSQRLQLATDTEARRAMVLGRISLYVENIPQMPDITEQQRRIDELKLQEMQLDQAVSSDAIQQKLESCLSNVNRYLSDYAKRIGLEYSDSPLRLDPRALTIVADTPERPIPMSEIGSGENHVGYHIVAHLALHTWFASRHRPVPSFLLLDQLSQAHFSPDALPQDGVTKEKLDSDRKAVKGLFGLIFDIVESLEGRFQVIITDHPDFSDDVRFQAALCERWRNGLKLVVRFNNTDTYHAMPMSNLFHRNTTGSWFISSMPLSIRVLSSSRDLTRMWRKNVRAIFEKAHSMRLSHEPCLGV